MLCQHFNYFFYLQDFSALFMHLPPPVLYVCLSRKVLAPKGLCTLYPPSKIMILLKQVVNLSCLFSNQTQMVIMSSLLALEEPLCVIGTIPCTYLCCTYFYSMPFVMALIYVTTTTTHTPTPGWIKIPNPRFIS